MRIIALIFASMLGTQCLAQTATQLAAVEKQISEGRYSWQNAKKLSAIKPVPVLPQPRFASGLIYDEVVDESVGSIAWWDLKVDSIIDNENMILRLDVDKRIWLQGIPTEGLIDSQSVRVIDHVQFSGTKSFNTVLGAKATIRVAKPLSKEENLKRLAEDVERANEESQYVVWRRKKGENVNGKFLSLKSSVVTIETRKGEKVRIPSNMLTDESLELAKEKAKDAKSKK